MPSRHLRRPGHAPRIRKRHGTCAAVAILALAAAALSAATGPASATAATAADARARSVSSTVRPVVPTGRRTVLAAAVSTQTLDWSPCLSSSSDPGLPSAYYRVLCATMLVPMDWDDPGDNTILKLSVTKLPASSQPAAGVLFTNPGGPGGAGADLPLIFISAGRKVLMRSQDIYGMDVRGSGNSTNVTCGGDVTDLLDPRDRSAANVDLMLDASQFAARACDVAGGNLLGHVNTSQTVRDVELLRTLTTADKINWLGYSAGTWLGAQYATAYPSHVGHMVLDSNTDFTTDWQTAFNWQPMGFERRFREDFLPWAAKYNSVFHLGRTAEAVRARYENIRAAMTPAAPVTSAISLDQLLASSMYDSALFPIAAQVMSELGDYVLAAKVRNATAMTTAANNVRRAYPVLLRGTQRFRQPMSSDTSDATFLAVTCNDTRWNGSRSSLAAGSLQAGQRYPLIGWSTIYEPCAFWNRPPLSLPVPTGAGLPPVLMVQSEHDPATPIEGAQDAAGHFSAARLLTVTGSGDHGLYAGLNGCVNQAVEAFIINGTLPAATCPGRGLPDPTEGVSTDSLRAAALGTPSATANSRATSRTTSQAVTAAARAGLPKAGTNPLLALDMIHARLGS